jgi:hypothetical protein
MALKQIKPNEIFVNQIEFNPKVHFYVYDGVQYLNNKTQISGAFTSSVGNVPVGFVSLFELNIDRNQTTTGLIYPFITKDGSLLSFKTISTTSFNSDFSYGDTVTGSYPLSASISRDFYQTGESRRRVDALRNTINYYSFYSSHFSYSSSLGNKATQPLNLVSIPSIFYGDSIKRGSIDLSFYVSGTLIGQLQDIKKNGELIQVGPSGSNGSGSVAGIALYTEGFIVLTGSWGLESGITRNYLNDISNQVTSSWLYFGTGLQGGEVYTYGNLPSSSFDIKFEGTNKTPVMTMLVHAERGEFNNSLNPTFAEKTQVVAPQTGSTSFIENKYINPANVVSSSYNDPQEYLEKTTFITKINLYDQDKNWIGVAKISKPVKKTQDRDLTFKLKLDL